MKGSAMKAILRILGVLLFILGGIWFFQGINVLPGSFMTGQSRWAINGVIAVVAGIVMIALSMKRKGSPPTV
jgi:uncharacterized membrane protein SirB2